MTEEREEYTPHPLGWEAQEAERIKNLPRDELVSQVDSESDSQQELIERLAEMVIEARKRVREVEIILSQCDGDGCPAWEALRDERARIEDLEKACKNERDWAHHYWRTTIAAEAWATLWKAKAKLDRKGWMGELYDIAQHPWVFRRAIVEGE